ncbi:MAG: D-alanine--D-alanine ligase [archaeon]
MNIAFLYNVKILSPSLTNEKAQIYAEFDAPKTIEGIKKAIEANGNKVHMIEANDEAYLELKKLKDKKKVDLVFNIAEGFYGEAREAQIPAMLEMLQIPYTGSGPQTLAITLDKSRTKEILSYYQIPCANFQVFSSEKEKIKKGLNFPMLVKPIMEGSSKGIMNNSLVKNKQQLVKNVREVVAKYKQFAVVEEFLKGREFTVGVIVKKGIPVVLPIIEVTFDGLPKNMNKFYSYEAKWFYDDPSKGEDPLVCPAKISKELKMKIEDTALRTFRALRCKDMARVDMRLNSRGVPCVLEVNALPGMIPDPVENSNFPKAARTAGISYNQMIGMIIDSAKRRYGLN